MTRAWLLLTVTVLAEVAATLLLKASDGFSHWWPSLGAVAGYLTAVVVLARVLTTLPASLAYIVWTGAGSALVVLAGAVLYDQVLTPPVLAGIVLVVCGVIVLNLGRGTS
ncbi:multidrug efflux SMR transporter [Amycolatopsis sp. YIM 10]|uniref:DMT family transporter n=1 Tax=Amycolatopsis sp. YIM 10 TaxID=2653857 RepID=UPI00128FD0AF|nr:multidrug efflux SMR transporter [Amycolatopsis sp. YIM 10]QFU89306.1 Multidrug resistance protein EbrB [Amycolatopsis sp. YIM 10]